MSLLVIAAHPDDEVLGCGGAIARLATQMTVRVIICTRRRVGGHLLYREEMRPYQRAATQAARVLGGSIGEVRVTFLDYPDEDLWGYRYRLKRSLEMVIEDLCPALVLSHTAADVNQDHRAVNEVCRILFRPHTCRATTFAGFEVPGSSTPAFAPSAYLRLSEGEVAQKLAAWDCYGMEQRPHPHPRSTDNVRALLSLRGAHVGADAAEAFEVYYTRVLY